LKLIPPLKQTLKTIHLLKIIHLLKTIRRLKKKIIFSVSNDFDEELQAEEFSEEPVEEVEPIAEITKTPLPSPPKEDESPNKKNDTAIAAIKEIQTVFRVHDLHQCRTGRKPSL
jgi:hypothetical protein